jgi:mannosyltransferase OCH1-like enzyme
MHISKRFILFTLTVTSVLTLFILNILTPEAVTNITQEKEPTHISTIPFYALFPDSKPEAKGRFENESFRVKTEQASQMRYQYYDGTDIPRLIHHSWKTDDRSKMDVELKQNLASFSDKNPDSIQIIWTDLDIQLFIRTFYSSLAPFFAAIPKMILKADLFRYLLLAKYGGIYSDIDTQCLKPISSWSTSTTTTSLMVGVEADPNREDWEQWYARRLQW